jgi:hypothetical protein
MRHDLNLLGGTIAAHAPLWLRGAGLCKHAGALSHFLGEGDVAQVIKE